MMLKIINKTVIEIFLCHQTSASYAYTSFHFSTYTSVYLKWYFTLGGNDSINYTNTLRTTCLRLQTIVDLHKRV